MPDLIKSFESALEVLIPPLPKDDANHVEDENRSQRPCEIAKLLANVEFDKGTVTAISLDVLNNNFINDTNMGTNTSSHNSFHNAPRLRPPKRKRTFADPLEFSIKRHKHIYMTMTMTTDDDAANKDDQPEVKRCKISKWFACDQTLPVSTAAGVAPVQIVYVENVTQSCWVEDTAVPAAELTRVVMK